MLDTKIMVISKTNSTVVVDVPELRLHRVWTQKEMALPIEKEVLAEAIYDPAVSYLFNEGLLYVKDLESKKELGLEDDDTTEEAVKIIDLNDKLMARMIKAMPEAELRETINKLTNSQKEELGTYAVEHSSDLKMDRIELISEACHRNILKVVENQRAADEEVKVK